MSIANSGHAQDILTAVDKAVDEHIRDVSIPKGTFNLYDLGETWSAVHYPAGINLLGAPTPRGPVTWGNRVYTDQVLEWKTILQMPFEVPTYSEGNPDASTWFVIDGSDEVGKPSRFSDIHLVGYRDIDPLSRANHYAVIIKDVADFRVDHSFFKHTSLGNVAQASRFASRPICRGVFDHCKLVNDYGQPRPYEDLTVGYGVGMYCVGTDIWEDDINKVLGKYGDLTVFVEDCYLRGWRHATSSGHGYHQVIRHSCIDHDFGRSVDAHGVYELVGTRATEVYDCEFISPIDWQTGELYTTDSVAIQLRGGGGVIFNNYFYQIGYSPIYGGPIALSIDGAIPEKCAVKDLWIWNNTLEECQGYVFDDAGYGYQEGVDYFLYAKPDYVPYPYPHPLTEPTPIPPLAVVAAVAVPIGAVILWWLLK